MNAWYRRCGKRLGDLALALLCVGIAGGVGAGLMAIIRLTSPGPALLAQARIGRAGRRFAFLKFRSMAEADGRVTAIGRWLRATAMDELPQLINILRGEMSFVGPRPLLPVEAEALARLPSGRARAALLPGLAGLTQRYAGKHPDPSVRLALDMTYAARCGFWLDAWIIGCAVGTSVLGRWEPAGAAA